LESRCPDIPEEDPEEVAEEEKAQKVFEQNDASFQAYKRKIDLLRAELRGLRQKRK
jgi:hypothetical protein